MRKERKILITGGAGFVGSALACSLSSEFEVSVLDSLKRRGSEINLAKLRQHGIAFIHGDIRNPSDFEELPSVDFIIDASAEPSVLSGQNQVVRPLLETNLIGTINILEYAKSTRARLIFLSTSRVYSIDALNNLDFDEDETRFRLSDNQKISGVTGSGINEGFPVKGFKSFYGASKLASELLIEEYNFMNYVPSIINRCGVIAGPGQFGKVDQGVAVLWMASHFWKESLTYIGFGGKGKQVRDILHIDDLAALIRKQIHEFDHYQGKTQNVGGGNFSSLSLMEMTNICEEMTGNKISIESIAQTRYADIPIYLSDNTKISNESGWRPTKNAHVIMEDIFQWLLENERVLKPILTRKG